MSDDAGRCCCRRREVSILRAADPFTAPSASGDQEFVFSRYQPSVDDCGLAVAELPHKTRFHELAHVVGHRAEAARRPDRLRVHAAEPARGGSRSRRARQRRGAGAACRWIVPRVHPALEHAERRRTDPRAQLPSSRSGEMSPRSAWSTVVAKIFCANDRQSRQIGAAASAAARSSSPRWGPE